MKTQKQTLAQKAADRILSMITVEKKFLPGHKLPNENEFAALLQISRTTLREAIRILVSHNVLEIRRGKGTFVVERNDYEHPIDPNELSKIRVDIHALYEMRMMVEPEIAWYAAQRATPEEIQCILQCGKQEELLIKQGKDRTKAEEAFHQAIARAAHNPYAEQLMPMIYEAIHSGVKLSVQDAVLVQDTLQDHKMIMEFLEARDPKGAKAAMQLHIRHAMLRFGISPLR
ncbi:MAG: FadR/GntR family transcriptional regulator [Massiliimalia sp.]|jgi:GntR family transcriptional repressor for pyruvate dehydrogenase complex